jgi:hypothetical protein
LGERRVKIINHKTYEGNVFAAGDSRNSPTVKDTRHRILYNECRALTSSSNHHILKTNEIEAEIRKGDTGADFEAARSEKNLSGGIGSQTDTFLICHVA